MGDRVEILVDGEKLGMLVERISLLYTVFARTDKMQVVQTPNIQLNNLWIENVTRSGPTPEIMYINISYEHTNFQDIELLRLEMEKFVRHPDNSREYQPDVTIDVADISDLKTIQLMFVIMYKANANDVMARLDRKSRFLSALAEACRKLRILPVGGGVQGTPGNPNYLVSCSAEDAAARRGETEEDRSKAREIPTGTDAENAEGAAAAAPGGHGALGGGDWFSRDDRTAPSMHEDTRVSLDSRRGEQGLPRSHSKGLRKAGETLSTTVSHQGSVSMPRGSTSLRATTSRRAYDEEAQLGSPTSNQQGGFLAPTPSQYGRSAAAQARAQAHAQAHQEADPYQSHPAQQVSGQSTMQPGGPRPGGQPGAPPPGMAPPGTAQPGMPQ